jgi:hypothetical protein
VRWGRNDDENNREIGWKEFSDKYGNVLKNNKIHMMHNYSTIVDRLRLSSLFATFYFEIPQNNKLNICNKIKTSTIIIHFHYA